MLLAYGAIRFIISINPTSLPRAAEIAIDGKALGFTLLLSMLATVIFGLAPALQASKSDLVEPLKEGTKGSGGGYRPLRLRSALVISEVALALTLLIGAGLLIKSLFKLTSIKTGFETDNLLSLQISLPTSKYDSVRQGQFFQDVLQRVQGLPGVRSAAVINFLPLTGVDAGTFITIEGAPVPEPGNFPTVSLRMISADYFRTMKIPFANGSDLTKDDAANHRLVINATLARRFFPHQNPIGRRIKFGRPEDPGPFLPIVGVASDIQQFGLGDNDNPTLYLPFINQPAMSMVVRTEADPMSFVPVVRDAILAVDKDQPIYEVRSMEDRLADQTAAPSFRTVILSSFAAVALLLAAAGIYGVIAYAVTQRTREISIRMALGAQQADIIKLIVKQGAMTAGVGIVIGLAMAFTLSRFLKAFLYEITATDLPAFIVSVAVLGGVALAANYLPARKASGVNPAEALRFD